MPDGIQTLTRTLDLVEDVDNGGFYFQQYRMDGTGASRISAVYKTREEAHEALDGDYVKWGTWR